MANEFAIAEGIRIEITQEQIKEIKDMYKDLEKEFKERIRILSNKNNISSTMRTQYLKDFSKDLSKEIEVLNSRLENQITSNMLEVAEAVVNDSNNLARQMGFGGIFTSQYYIPQKAVERVVSGKIYEGKWTLSKAIWTDNQKKLNDINLIVGKGLAGNKSTYEIAKDLERYVNPNARKLWDWSKVYPGTSKKIDYNAQRLARTMVSHAYEEAFVESTKNNPFIESYMWLASGSDRMCEICEERDGKIFAKDELPLDHPNGMCTFSIVMEKSMEQVAKDLKNWVNNTGDANLNKQIDNYADELGYNVKEMTANTDQVQNADNKSSSVNPVTLQNYAEAANEFRQKRADEIGNIVPFLEMNDTLNSLVENNEFRVRFPNDDAEVLKSILSDGRLKTQFETNTSGGQLNTDIREKASYNLFNTPKGIDAKDYEKYGYLGSKDVSKDWNPQLGFYGDGIITLKKENVYDRTTLTLGDSLRDAADGRYIMGSLVNNIDSTICVGRPSMINEFNDRINKSIDEKGIDNASKVGYAVRSYIELQYHGDITLKDIDSITIDKYLLDEVKNDSNLSKIAKESGIKFQYTDEDKVKDYKF